MTFLGVALSRMTLGVCKPPLADFGGREKREVFICHHSMMQRPPTVVGDEQPCRDPPVTRTAVNLTNYHTRCVRKLIPVALSQERDTPIYLTSFYGVSSTAWQKKVAQFIAVCSA